MAASVMMPEASLKYGSFHDRWSSGRSLKKGPAKNESECYPLYEKTQV